MKKLINLTLAIVLLLTLPACTRLISPAPSLPPGVSPPPTIPPEGFQFTMANFPKLDGSTANIPLGEAVMALLTGETRENCRERIDFTGTNSAYKKLVSGETEIILAYEMPDEARSFMDDREIELELAEIGRDALVFLINSANTVNNLTTEQLQGIYTGEITDWQELGGQPGDIMPYQRNPTSGSQTLMEKLVMQGKTMTTPPQEYIIEEMEGLVAAVAAAYQNTRPAIGYNVYYYVTQMRPDPNVTLLSVDGVAPSTETISSKQYPFCNSFYAAIRRDTPQNSPARILFDWLQTKTGQELVAHEGYAPVK
ncbi:MAG: substrate-binding domain-containing protein [Clostridia bacterium]|nr:substrate-binding domain-containing protein [Clostridia bacterium]